MLILCLHNLAAASIKHYIILLIPSFFLVLSVCYYVKPHPVAVCQDTEMCFLVAGRPRCYQFDPALGPLHCSFFFYMYFSACCIPGCEHSDYVKWELTDRSPEGRLNRRNYGCSEMEMMWFGCSSKEE